MIHPFEHKSRPLAPRRVFVKRVMSYGFVTLSIVVFSLVLGTFGYHFIGDCEWVDAFYNASMILTGMGPVTPMTGVAAKIFASVYALYSAVAVLSMVAILMAPIIHRFLHRLHLEEHQDDPR